MRWLWRLRMRGYQIAVVALALFASHLPSPAAAADVFRGNTRTALASLTVADELRAGYDRDLFRHWIDVDRDGCNTRYEVLIAEARSKPRISGRCSLSGGRWVSAYDGVQATTVRQLDIDHVVPLAEAWDSGASRWSSDTRERFANDLDDPRALIAVTASSNRQKSDQDPAEWLPQRAQCTYLVHWLAVKVRWSLSIDAEERDALRALITDCGLTSIEVTRASITLDETAGTPTTPTDPQPTNAQPADAPTQATFVTPGAFCAPADAVGFSAKGVRYTCKSSASESRNRWRR